MLKDFLDSAQLSKSACAGLVGVSSSVFDDWMSGQKPIPTGHARVLGALLGVPTTALEQRTGSSNATDQTPAIWFRLRDAGITETDRSHIALIRRLAHLYDQFETATGAPSVTWRGVFDSVLRQVDPTALSPAEQGRAAARIVRTERQLGHGATGIGSVFRSHLRALGLLIVETPVPHSKVEGCSFYVQSGAANRPCIFANTHSNTWFRRNFVLWHETAHLIFDAALAGASIDFANGTTPSDAVAEQRADAFAQEMLAPAAVVRHVAQAAGIRWDALTPEHLAVLVAEIEVEPRVILKAAVDAKLIDAETAEHARGFDIKTLLEQRTERALPAMKYFARHPEKRAEWLDKRTTTATTAARVSLRLPSAYVQRVVEAAQRGAINWTKAAELLLVDRRTFQQRFGELMPATE